MVCLLFVGGCKDNENNEMPKIPTKITEEDTSVPTSPINSHNLDNYMFRDDVQYVDLRSSYMVLEEGYVAGFEFIPYYNIIASFSEGQALYQMVAKDGIGAGQVGGFEAQFEESESIIKRMFAKNKYIFFISQGGSESSYMINLLLQLGYDGNLLYNVGGVSNSEGIESYKSISTNKYYVEGNGGFDVSVNYDFVSELTPIE